MIADTVLDIFFMLIIAATALCLILLGVVLMQLVMERTMIMDCLNNGGHWLTNYAIGCTYPMG